MMTRRITMTLAASCFALIAFGVFAFAATGDASTIEPAPVATTAAPTETESATTQPPSSESAQPETTPVPSDGAALYATHCASCHGDDGGGGSGGPVDDLNMPLDDVIDITANGVPRMPAYADKLTSEEIKAVSEYTLTLDK